jgi:hypothetical protein
MKHAATLAFFGCLALSAAARLPAETRCLPHMAHSASMVEVSPRGTRIITAAPGFARREITTNCAPRNNSCTCDYVGSFIYYPRTNEVVYFKQTLGPMAYTAAIVCALASLYFLGEDAKRENSKKASATLAAALCFVKVPVFPTQSDEVHFWASLAMTAFAAFYNESDTDVCMFALISLADAIYRTPETPYAAIICVLLAIQMWNRVIAMAAAGDMTVWRKIDFLSVMIYTLFTAETAMVPQFEHQEDWPIYGGTAAYVTFAVAVMSRYKTPSVA